MELNTLSGLPLADSKVGVTVWEMDTLDEKRSIRLLYM